MIVYGQTVSIYSINKNGSKGQLTRTETYQNKQLIELNQYEASGELEFTMTKTYNAQQQLIKEVKSIKKGHEYDLIKEFDYDSKGRKIYTLFGNNRTGKWSSEGYSYNVNEDVDTIFFYQKNGDLTTIRVFDYTYNKDDKKVKIIQKNIDLETDEETIESTSIYDYNKQNFDIIISELDEKGTIIYKEWITNNADNQPKIMEYELPDFPKIKKTYYYNTNKKTYKIIESTGDEQTMKITFKYNGQGKLIEKKYLTQNNYSGEIYVY